MLEKCDVEQLRMVLNTYSVQRKSIPSVQLETYPVDGAEHVLSTEEEHTQREAGNVPSRWGAEQHLPCHDEHVHNVHLNLS